MSARVAVLQLPGVNCEAESVRALERAGMTGEVFPWRRPATELRDYHAYVVPGGFSYQDRVRAGALASKDPLLEVLGEEAERGKPVLGICNGAQVLVETGLVPNGRGVELALARNRMPGRSGYYTRWVWVRVEASPCVFTRALEPGTLLPLPMAHGEGRFVGAPGRMESLARGGQTPLRYATPGGEVASEFPDNPNGAEAAAAAVCNARGNVLAIMPHPERAQHRGQVSRAVSGRWAADADEAADARGPGLLLFDGLCRHLEEV
jgi:phosphoribosylformylglycinamidine synthase